MAANRLSANRLSANRLSANKLAASKLSENRLEANSVAAKMLSTADGREVYSYIISCALPEGKEVDATISGAPDSAPPDTLYTCGNGNCSFPGSLGLADYWIDHRLDVKGQRWVTACLLARVNYFGVKVIISLRGVAPNSWSAGMKPNATLLKKARSMATSSAIPTSLSIGMRAEAKTQRQGKPVI